MDRMPSERATLATPRAMQSFCEQARRAIQDRAEGVDYLRTSDVDKAMWSAILESFHISGVMGQEKMLRVRSMDMADRVVLIDEECSPVASCSKRNFLTKICSGVRGGRVRL